MYVDMDEEEKVQREMGTTYDPPTDQNTRENPSNDILALMEQ